MTIVLLSRLEGQLDKFVAKVSTNWSQTVVFLNTVAGLEMISHWVVSKISGWSVQTLTKDSGDDSYKQRGRGC